MNTNPSQAENRPRQNWKKSGNKMRQGNEKSKKINEEMK